MMACIKVLNFLVIIAIAFSSAPAFAAGATNVTGKKVFVIDSYHEGYAWSDGVMQGIRNVLGNSGVILKFHHMDTKRNRSEEFMQKAGEFARGEITKFNPDVVIASDDNAQKYVVTKYYQGTNIPFVFCGVNWDETPYNYPLKNVTGMVEIALIPQLLEFIGQIGSFERIGFLAANVRSMRKEIENYEKHFHLVIEKQLVNTMADWVKQYKEMQEKVDLLLVGNVVGINDWDDKIANKAVLDNTTILTATVHQNIPHLALLALAKIPIEQGEWAARAAIKILSGTKPAEIKIVRNRRGAMYLNKTLARTLNVEVPKNIKMRANIIILTIDSGS